jgi:hypothetical protein
VLGERTNPLLDAPPDSAAADTARATPPAGGSGTTPATPPSSSGSGTASAPPAPHTPSGGAASGGTCWRIQVAAPATREEADRKRAAAESQLLIAMVVEPEKGLFKIRSKDCWERAVADRLRDRAVGSGFDGAFALGVPRP